MVATVEQLEQIAEMKVRHQQEFEQFDLWCEERRLQIQREHDREFDLFYMRNGGRRDRSINEGRKPRRAT
jgi:hypothetical protein